MTVFKLSLTMLKVWSQLVIDEWVILFKALIDILHYPKIEKEILQTIFILSDISQPTISRYISARLIGFISKKMTANYNPQVLEKARTLCQDHDVEVRKVMAGEVLMSICSVIPSDMFELDIYEKVIELVYDAEISVKVVAIRLVFQVSEFIGEDVKRTRMVSLFVELLQSVNLEVVKVMSEIVGDVLGRLETVLRKTSHLATILSVY